MNPISPSSLFHFTSSFEVLLKIITNGFRYSYAFERFSSDLLNDRIYDGIYNIDSRTSLDDCGIAIPMVSFCDIPITRTLPHAERYGKYFIGLNKGLLSTMLNPIFNPVIYGSSSNLFDAITFFAKIRKNSNIRLHNLYKSKIEDLEEIASRIDFSSVTKDDIINEMPTEILNEINTGIDGRFYSDFLLALYKPVQGKDVYGNECNFYDEREWRAFVMHNISDNMPWVFGCTPAEFLKDKETWNEVLSKKEEAFIKLTHNSLSFISHIGVEKESEIETVADYIMNESKTIFGGEEVSTQTRLKLVSKITSFERIEKNY